MGLVVKVRQELEYVCEVFECFGLELFNISQVYFCLVVVVKEILELGGFLCMIFEGVVLVIIVLYFICQEINGILFVLEQMVSKGKVQIQELVL